MYKCRVKGCSNKVFKEDEYCEECSDIMFAEINKKSDEEYFDELNETEDINERD